MSYDVKRLFDELRLNSPLGPTLDKNEVDGVNVILDVFENAPISWVAYALATAWHETVGTMQPIKERGSNAYFTRMYDVTGEKPDRARRNGNTKPGDGPKYCGRGYVQLTWKNNYAWLGKTIGVDLVKTPDNAMVPAIAAEIMATGMTEGLFTGVQFEDCLPRDGLAHGLDFARARTIINGRDDAEQIAVYAIAFQRALVAADWGK